MRILFLLTQDLESPLGIGRVWPLARELVGRGHQVRIAALHSNWAGLTERRFIKNGVMVEYVAPMHVRKIGSQKQYYSPFKLAAVVLRASWALARAALSAPVDIIQVCKPHPMNSLAGLLAYRLKGGVLCVDCDDYEAAVNRFGAGWQQRVVAFFERHVPRAAQVVTTHTDFMHDKLVAWGCPAERIHYLSNGVDLERFTPPSPPTVSALREKLGLQHKQVVAYLGSLSLTSHPIDLLVEAFKILNEQLPKTALLLVGGGEDAERLGDLAQHLGIGQDVYFTGRVVPAELPLYYALADVTVDPVYDNEAARGRSPLKMFESWASGVPFITAPVGERVKLAGNPPASLLVSPPGDRVALAKGIQSILESPILAQQLRQQGLERVKKFTWDLLAEQIEAVYQEAVLAQYDRKHHL